jgi:hypothetical protein
MFLFLIALYVYTSLALMTIAQKLNHPNPWLAWIPFANIALVLQLGNFHWAWTFLLLIPILGWIPLIVLAIISTWRIYEARNYPGWLALIGSFGFIPFVGQLASVASIAILGFVAWRDQPGKKVVSKTAPKLAAKKSKPKKK